MGADGAGVRASGDGSEPGLGRDVFSPAQWQLVVATLRLSPRETEIIQAIFDDQREASIAAALGISVHTVHSHIERLYRKLGVRSRCSLVVCVVGAVLRALNDAPRRRDPASGT